MDRRGGDGVIAATVSVPEAGWDGKTDVGLYKLVDRREHILMTRDIVERVRTVLLNPSDVNLCIFSGR